MKKGLIINNERMGAYEIEKGFASFKTIMEYYVGDMLLCNDIVEKDLSVYDNMINVYDEETEEYKEIYQYYLCNLNEYDKEILKGLGFIISYSDMLNLDIIGVDHYGTSWDYVLTDVKLFNNYEDLKEYEESEGE